MLYSALTAIVAFSASALALTTATTFNVTSNPIYTPNNGDVVPAGKPYKITWGPTESGTVSIVLLRGPSSNAVPQYAIAENIPNTGSFTWTPKTDLEPDTLRYGLQLIIDANGQYQYSTQFGISNPDYNKASSSAVSTAAPTTTATSSAGEETTTTSYETVIHTTKSYVTSLITITTSSVPVYVPTTSSSVEPPATYAPATSGNFTVTYAPTGTSKPSVSTYLPPPPQATGAASSIKAASGLLLGVVGVAAMLL